MKTDLKVPINRLKQGANAYEWHIGCEFFGTFENSEILDADLSVNVVIDNDDYDVSVKGSISGTVTVLCDRCMEKLTLRVETGFEDDEFEDCDVVDLSQDVYDYTCLALPLQRIHPEGECDAETIKYLSK